MPMRHSRWIRIKQIILVICFLLIGSNCHCYESIPFSCKRNEKTIVIKQRKPFNRQIRRKPRHYIIRYVFDLNGRTINLPDGCTLEFQGGLIKNGCLNGKYSIIAEPSKIFDNVDISSFTTHPFYYSWIAGSDAEIKEDLLKSLPAVTILFSNHEYFSNQQIDLTSIDHIDYNGLNISFSEPIKAYCETVAGGLGDQNSLKYDHKCNYVTSKCIQVSEELTNIFGDYLISIKTADRTIRDCRPGGQYNLPSLYKGITTTIDSISYNRVYLIDTIGFFPNLRLYSSNIIGSANVYSTWVIRKPKHIVLRDCSFTSTDKKANISIAGKDILIENCRFVSSCGADAVLSINNTCGALIKKCSVEGAWASGNDNTNYGIQVNSSSRVQIDSCYFYNNRRGVDFSGAFETRYSVVSNSYFKNDVILDNTGSAVGGHSTSYGNKFCNNIIEGLFQIGIQCRGEDEVVEGNIFNAYCNGAIVSTSINTKVINNCSRKSEWGLSSNALFIGDDYDINSLIAIEDNYFEIRDRFIYHFNPKRTFFSIKRNNISFIANNSAKVVQFATDNILGVYDNNTIKTSHNRLEVRNLPYSK